jgi:hypothetical protein
MSDTGHDYSKEWLASYLPCIFFNYNMPHTFHDLKIRGELRELKKVVSRI